MTRRPGCALGIALLAVGLLVLGPARGGESASRSAAAPRAERTHLVKRGETLTRIAARYGVTVKALIAANRLKSSNASLRVGQRLQVPRTRTRPATRRARVAVPQVPADIVLSGSEPDGQALAFGWPVEGPVISQFGWRPTGWHRGLDIKAEMGTPILAAGDGVVIASGPESRYGNVVRIEHASRLTTIYAHQLQSFVEVGETVQAGQVIGQVGRTGRASTYHLHFEIRQDGTAYDPLQLLPPPRPAPAQVARFDPETSDDE